jgi:WD40 repeat protein/serine/threonine protein kinase/DNA-binding XRE family transcriptional regulator
MDSTTSFGYWLRRRRKALDLTQAELAQRVGCVVTTIKKIEADERRPSKQLAERLADCLAIPPVERAPFLQAARAELAVDRLATPLPPLAPPPAPEPRAQPPLKGYDLREQIGAGGFGTVYRAVQPAVGRDVAVKIILPEYANHPEFIRRFEAEAQLVARLEHPHIVPLYDYWRERDGAYLVMRYMRGGSLETVLRSGPWALDRATRLLDQVGAALALAHRQGVVHRDLKPANVLLDEDGNVYLADFGIAKDLRLAQEVAETQPGTVVGSPAYLSPEQIKDEPVTPRSDIYSLGVLLYELLTGQQPFGDLPPAERLHQQLHALLPPLQARQSDLPEALNAVIQRATAKAPDERYSDVVSMVVDWHQATTNDQRPTTKDEPTIGVDPSSLVLRPSSQVLTLTDLAVVANPYKGLRAFGEADAADFFGRETFTQQLLTRLGEEHELARFLAIVGPSGSGKSSVVRAGLIPALRSGGLPGSEHWFVVGLLPGTHPLEELEAALLRVAVNPPPSLLEQLQADERGLLRAVKRVLPGDATTELVLVIDQFEEVFTLVSDEAARAQVLNSLVTAVLDERSRVRIVITLRADFTDRPLQYVDFGELMRERTAFVLPLSPDELERAIVRPAARVGVSLEPELVAAIVREVGDQPGTLPLLQYALTELFERREGHTPTLTAYRASGGVLGALTRRAEELYSGLDAVGQEVARQLFLRLITLGEGAEDTRRRVRMAELATNDQRPTTKEDSGPGRSSFVVRRSSELDRVIDLYGRYRLLTFDRDPITREPTVEVAHEALIREWGRLRAWLDESRDDLRLHRRLMAAATEWVSAGRDTSFLATGARLAQFEALAASGDPRAAAHPGSGRGLVLNEDEQAYLDASLAERDAQRAREAAQQAREAALERRSRRRLRGLVAVLAVATAVALALTGFAFRQRNIAQTERTLAFSRELAGAANLNLDVDPERSILLALQAVTLTDASGQPPLLEPQDALHRAVQTSRVQLTLRGHTRDLVGLTFSRDGTRLATIGEDRTVRIWETATGKELLTLPISLTMTGAAYRILSFSPDGTKLAAGGSHLAKVWDAVSGQELLALSGHTDEVLAVAFSPDGTRIATASADGVAKIWDATAGRELLTLTGSIQAVNPGASKVSTLAFSPDGTRIATASNDNTIKVWDVISGQMLLALPHTDVVSNIAFSPDGKRLATGTFNTTWILWDAATGQSLLTIFGHASLVTGIGFDPTGKLLATASEDGTAKIWDTVTGRELLALSGHTSGITGVAFSPDGRLLATASRDRTAKLWDVSPQGGREWFNLVAHTDGVWGLAYSSDARSARIATGSRDKTVKIWNAKTGDELFTLPGFTFLVQRIAFSPDGTRLLVNRGTENEFDATVWDLATRTELLTLHHDALVFGVAYSPDGKYIATGSADGVAKIWEAKTGNLLHVLSGHTALIQWIAFSPDAKRLATASEDGTAKVWDVATGKTLLTLSLHTGVVWGVAFSPDGSLLATVSNDGTAKIWEAATGHELFTLTGHTGPVFSVAFSPDGQRLATASVDRTVKIWDVSAGPGAQPLTLYGHTAAVLGVAFSPDGTRLVTTSRDRTARVYALRIEDLVAIAKTRVTRSLTAEECQKYLHAQQCPPPP